jgi:hypothetical protein
VALFNFPCTEPLNLRIAIIKGSELARRSDGHFLDRSTYVAGTRSIYVHQDQRSAIYDLFERYQSMLKLNNDKDEADRSAFLLIKAYLIVDEVGGRTMTLLSAMQCGCTTRTRVDFLLVSISSPGVS